MISILCGPPTRAGRAELPVKRFLESRGKTPGIILSNMLIFCDMRLSAWYSDVYITRKGEYYTTESAPADISQQQATLQGGESQDLAISDFNVAQGVFKKRGRSLKFTIDEFYDSCFSITFLVPETGQKWVVFIPPPEVCRQQRSEL